MIKNNLIYIETSAKSRFKIFTFHAFQEALAENTPNKDEEYHSPETNVTSAKKQRTEDQDISISAHISPCPSGELRCVDGRCITLAQLCDGIIDCSDHADEDNCYT